MRRQLVLIAVCGSCALLGGAAAEAFLSTAGTATAQPGPPLPALPTPNMVPGYGAPPVTLPPSGGTLLPSLPAAAPVQPQSGGLLGGNQNAVLIGVGLLLAYRLGGRFGHPRRGR